MGFIKMLFSFPFLCSSSLLGVLIAPVTSQPKHERQTIITVQETYDFVIVGGGTSGLTVANRLTENPNTTVLVIEYGIFDQKEDFLTIPGLASTGNFDLYYDELQTEPVQGLDGKSFKFVSPAVVGGPTAINGMLFDRGSKENLDSWVELGNDGWGWDELLKYYKKSETFTPSPPDLSKAFNITWDTQAHGNTGPIQTSIPSFMYPELVNFVQAWSSVGIPSALDNTNGSGVGIAWMDFAINPVTKTRCSARVAHYDDVAPVRPNYHVLTKKAVDKVLFEGSRAVGVRYVDRDTGDFAVVRAGKEVILAAGAIRTPQILQLSGIGPAELLEGIGIEVVEDLPVGYNFQDHPEIGHRYNFSSRLTPNSAMLYNNATYQNEQEKLYRSEKIGAYTTSRPCSNTHTYLSLSQLTSSPFSITSENATAAYPPKTPIPVAISEGYDLQSRIISNTLASNLYPVALFPGLVNDGSALTLLTPSSRGTIFINSTNILDQPRITNNVLGTKSDMNILSATLLKSREAFSSSAWTEMGPTEISPGTDLDVEEGIRKNAYPGNKHLCCTASMMPRDKGGVVDSKLLVYGVQGLRVVDASSWPLIGTTGGSSTVYAVAEKAADLIKEKYATSV